MNKNTARISQSLTALVVGINHPVALVIAKELSSQGVDVDGVTSDWKSNKTSFQNIPRSIQVFSNIDKIQPGNLYDYLLIFEPLIHPDKLELIKKVFSYTKQRLSKLVFIQSLGGQILISTEKGFLPVKQEEWDLHGLAQTIESLSQKHSITGRLIYYQDVYGSPGLPLGSPVNLLFSHLQQQKIPVIGDQSQKIYPLHEVDAANQIKRALFTGNTQFMQHQVRGEKPYALISMAFQLQKTLAQRFQIDTQITTHSPEEYRHFSLNSTQSLVPPKIELSEGLVAAITEHQKSYKQNISPEEASIYHVPTKTPPNLGERSAITDQDMQTPTGMGLKTVAQVPVSASNKLFTHNQSSNKTVTKPSSNRSRNRWNKIIMLLILISITTVIMFTPSIVISSLTKKAHVLEPGNTDKQSVIDLRDQIQMWGRINDIYKSLIEKSTPSVVSTSINSLLPDTGSTQIHIDYIDVQSDLLTATNAVLGNNQSEPYTLLSQARSRLNRIYTQISAGRQNQDEIDMNSVLGTNRSRILKIINALDMYPQLIPSNKQVNVMVILQNHTELRPTGGFIEAVALLKFDQGKLQDTQSYNVYQLDSQLKGRVEPPEKIKTLLGESNWFLRDANWDPHFYSTANNASWFLGKQTNQEADVVVGINSLTIFSLLHALEKPIRVEGKTVTAGNVIDLIYSEPASLGAKENPPLIGKIFHEIINQVKIADTRTQARLMRVTFDHLENSQIQVSTKKPEVIRGLVELGWSGQIIDPICPAALSNSRCLVDYLMPVETNIGVNRANRAIQRDRAHTIEITPDKVIHTSQIIYHNQSQSGNWPAGEYKNYLRWYLPENIELESISIDGEKINSSQYDQSDSYQKNIIGHVVGIPVNSTREVQIVYSIPNQYSPGFPESYTWLLQKQAGLTDESITINLKLPASSTIKSSSHQIIPDGNNYKISGVLDKNLFIAVELSP